MKRVLSLFDLTTTMLIPWAKEGHECWAIDIKHKSGVHQDENGVYRVGANLIDHIPRLLDYDIVFAFPPCTNLAVSGARHFRSKGLRGLRIGIELVERAFAIAEASGAPYFVENPVSHIASYVGPANHTFHPYEYAGYLSPEQQESEAYTKKTCLWTNGGFVMPEKRPVPLPEAKSKRNKIHYMSPGEDRADKRSATPMGFAIAVFEANAYRAKGATVC